MMNGHTERKTQTATSGGGGRGRESLYPSPKLTSDGEPKTIKVLKDDMEESSGGLGFSSGTLEENE